MLKSAYIAFLAHDLGGLIVKEVNCCPPSMIHPLVKPGSIWQRDDVKR